MYDASLISSDTVDMLVVALCADYERRRHAINQRTVSHRTEMEYRYLNFKVYNAAAEVVGAHSAPMMINEIGAKKGYAKSDMDEVSEKTYKRKKREIKLNIAKMLHLID